MLLGMSFVLSKQYSDDLSQKVSRGVRRNFAEGKSAIPKHGYLRTKYCGAKSSSSLRGEKQVLSHKQPSPF